MTAFQDLTFFWGETWELEIDAVDQYGALFTPAYVAFRAVSASGVAIDVASPDSSIVITGPTVVINVGAAAQTFPAPTIQDAYLEYEARAYDQAGDAYTQLAGMIRVRPSVFSLFPFTPPWLGAPALTLAGGGYLRLASGGRLLLAA